MNISTLIGNWNKESLFVGILALEASLHPVLARCSVTPLTQLFDRCQCWFSEVGEIISCHHVTLVRPRVVKRVQMKQKVRMD